MGRSRIGTKHFRISCITHPLIDDARIAVTACGFDQGYFRNNSGSFAKFAGLFVTQTRAKLNFE